ncbi:hypothetical protein [Caulobacter phage BL198]|uniref:Uncharacterized protein n=1 Tax=Caulobacter phage BL198 TaxID=3020395 RepID=A0AAE9X0Y2_9CAUD|nr:hypothetical protein [Caulobacter phage BL198]
MFTHVFIAKVLDHADFSSTQAMKAFVGEDRFVVRRAAEAWADQEAVYLKVKQEKAGCSVINIAPVVYHVESEVVS